MGLTLSPIFWPMPAFWLLHASIAVFWRLDLDPGRKMQVVHRPMFLVDGNHGPSLADASIGLSHVYL
jgi:hypothetical protein